MRKITRTRTMMKKSAAVRLRVLARGTLRLMTVRESGGVDMIEG